MNSNSQTPKLDLDLSCNTNDTERSENETDDDNEENLIEWVEENDSKNYKDVKKQGWALTIFKKSEYETFKNETVARYRIAGYELCPKTDKPHMQCFIYFKNKQSFNRMKNKYPSSHIGFVLKCPMANKKYCSGDTKKETIIKGYKIRNMCRF